MFLKQYVISTRSEDLISVSVNARLNREGLAKFLRSMHLFYEEANVDNATRCGLLREVVQMISACALL